jgi:hypothetical protein
MTTDNMARVMDKIQKLLAKADATQNQFPEEAASFRAHVEKLMREYRIEEEQLIATDPTSIVPVMHTIMVSSYESEFAGEYEAIMAYIISHTGVLAQYRRPPAGSPPGSYVDMFGYDGDLRMTEWLWSSARLVFGSHLEPSIDPHATDQVNAYNLRQSGMLRKDIARKLWGANTPANRSRAQRLYVAECKVRGEQPALTGLGTDATMYRDAYASGFLDRLYGRLRAARNAADVAGGALVFPGREERVKEFLYAAYPHRRPKPKPEGVVATVIVPDTTPAKVDKRRKDWTQADQRAWDRRNGTSAQRGHAAGRDAAGKVDVAPTHERAQRVDAPEPRGTRVPNSRIIRLEVEN